MKINGTKKHRTSSNSTVTRSGFTLIELLIVMVIIGILAAATLGVLTRFNQTQSLGIKYEDMKNDIYFAKSSALSQVIKRCKPGPSDPAGTKVFQGYLFKYNASSYTVEEKCSDGTTFIVRSVTLPAGITLGSSGSIPGSILFKPLDGGTDIGSSPIDIDMNSGTRTKTIRVYKSGVIEGRTD
jgi:prepilin-type N-terminal cleavage/methylation domain-containing protein